MNTQRVYELRLKTDLFEADHTAHYGGSTILFTVETTLSPFEISDIIDKHLSLLARRLGRPSSPARVPFRTGPRR